MADKLTPISIDEPWRGTLSAGLGALHRQDYQAALRLFEQALERWPDQPEVLLAAGREMMRAGHYSRARISLTRAQQLRPSAASAATLARLLGLHCGEAQAAFTLLQGALKASPEALELHVIRGELLLKEDAFSEARAAFAFALDRDCSHVVARLGLARTFNAEGIALGKQGHHDRAIFALKKAADLDPRWAAPLVNMGVVFGRLGKRPQALNAYLEALERDPENPVAKFNVGTTYHEQGELEQALAVLEELVEIHPDYPHGAISLANILGDLRRFDEAIALLLEQLEFDGTSAECWSSLGLAYACSGNIDRGVECLEQAVAFEPDYFNAYHNLAVLYASQGHIELARQVMQRAETWDTQKAKHVLRTDPSLSCLKEGPKNPGPRP